MTRVIAKVAAIYMELLRAAGYEKVGFHASSLRQTRILSTTDVTRRLHALTTGRQSRTPRPTSTRPPWTLSACPNPNIPWPRYVMICPNSEPKVCSKNSRRYRLANQGYSICVLFLKLFEPIYAPLTAGLLQPFPGDRHLAPDKRCRLDRLYQRLTDDLAAPFSAVGLKTAA
jgi:hypothetical protein